MKHDIPLGDDRWLTVVSPEDPEGTELLLEPSDHPAVQPYREALVAAGDKDLLSHPKERVFHQSVEMPAL